MCPAGFLAAPCRPGASPVSVLRGVSPRAPKPVAPLPPSAVVLRFLAPALVLGLASPPAAGAQTAQLAGRVTDAQGAVLPGVTVTASSPAPAPPATAVSDDAGEYALALAPGPYTVTFTMGGFEPQQREDVRLTAGSPRVLDVTLTIGRIAEQVDVVAVTPTPRLGR